MKYNVSRIMYHVSRNAGFTLIEVMTAAVLIVVIAGGLLGFTMYYLNNYSYTFTASQQIGQTQSSLTTLIREIREIRYGEDGSWPLADTQDNSFTFYSDVTDDGRSDKIRYFLDGTILKKGVIEPTQPPSTYPSGEERITIMAENVITQSKPVFTYYNGSWPQDTTNNPLSMNKRIADTRFVDVYLRIGINATSSAQPFELTSGVAIRSLKDNL